MSKIEKIIFRLISNPKDFTYRELEKVLSYFGYNEVKRGKSASSRRAFINSKTKHIIRLHKPHLGTILKSYQIKNIIEELRKEKKI